MVRKEDCNAVFVDQTLEVCNSASNKDFLKNFPSTSIYVWDAAVKPPYHYCEELPTCFCPACGTSSSSSTTAKPSTTVKVTTTKPKGCEYEKKGEVIVKENNKLGEVDMGKEYSVTFELFIKEYGPKKGYKDVIQLTASGGEGQIGDRNPSVFLTDNLNIHVGVSLNNNWNYHFNSPQSLKENKWYKVKLTQKLENGKYVFETLLDNKSFKKVENKEPREFRNVKIYAGLDKHWPAPESVKIRNLIVKSC